MTVTTRLLLALLALRHASGVRAELVYANDVARDEPMVTFPERFWHQAMSQANVTSAVQNVTGYNFTEKYPGEPVDAWTLSISVVGNYPLYPSRRLSAAQLTYTPPSRLGNSSTHDSWDSSAFFAQIDLDETVNVNGNCQGVFSEECLTALQSGVDNGDLTNPALRIPEACSDELGAEQSLNRVQGNVSAGGFKSPLEPILHNPDDFEYYDNMIRKVFVTVIGFTEYKSDNSKPIPGILSCIRPNQFKEGARTLQEAMDSGSIGQRGPTSWAMLMSLAMTGFAMMLI